MKFFEILNKKELLIFSEQININENFNDTNIQHIFNQSVKNYSEIPSIGNTYYILKLQISELPNKLFVIGALSHEQITNISDVLITLNSGNQINISPQSRAQYYFLLNPIIKTTIILQLKLQITKQSEFHFEEIPELWDSPNII